MNGIDMLGNWIVLTVLCLPVVLILLSSKAVSAHPCTLYKEKDIENARQNAAKYGWAREIVDGWKKDVAFTMGKERSFLEEMVP
ncbi:MAG: hypothetical protein O2954_01925, partial [bacterium]|nr:hypothetical protein [bacterium]